MRDIGGNTRPTDDVVEGELADPRVELQQEGQRLPDPTCRPEYGDFGGLG